MHCLKAFSLIELMVVIAIVGVLAAVAMPAYRTYQVKARFVQVVTLIEKFKKESILYRDRTGAFPDQMQLGLADGACTPNSTMPYVYCATAGPISAQCQARYTEIFFGLTPADMGMVAATTFAELYFAIGEDANGRMTTVCYVSTDDPRDTGTAASDGYLPNCVRSITPIMTLRTSSGC